MFALGNGADPLIGRRYREQPPSSSQLDSKDKEDNYRKLHSGRSRNAGMEDDQRLSVSVRPSMKKWKSIVDVCQRRAELDKMLDLYSSINAHK